MIDLKNTLKDIHFKVGEMYGIMSTWQQNCTETHNTVDKRLEKIEDRILYFLWALIGLVVTILLK